MNKKRQSGYSLVEVSLALLVVGVGLLAVFGLFPDALSSSRKSVEATEISAFAEFVFESMEGSLALNYVGWDTEFDNAPISGNDATALVARTHSLEGCGDPSTPSTQPQVQAKGVATNLLYYWKPGYFGESAGLNIDKYITASFTYTLDINYVDSTPGGGEAKYARLEVWPGDVRAFVTSGTGVVFYREFMPLR